MCATRTQDIDATVEQAEAIRQAGGDLVRVAVDSAKDVEALAEIRRQTRANLVVDLQENYRLAASVAPHVDKVRYNPGHLYHHEREKPVRDKVAFLAEIAERNDVALRVGVNCGSVDPVMTERFGHDDVGAMQFGLATVYVGDPPNDPPEWLDQCVKDLNSLTQEILEAADGGE